jgi:hypothetical protein
VNLAAVIAALQAFVSQHPSGGAACMLRPENDASITRNDIRAIARVEVSDDEVIIYMGEPVPTTLPSARMSSAHLLKQLAALPSEWKERPVVISQGLQKADDHYSIDFRHPVRNTGVATGPNEELFLLAAQL